ncbi:MAG: ClbS/DfsB family four-helix bundle protein [Anaerolineae bacterium]|nr:ClbS/DfsB family four-helix bundle protein [Anaerolineae bacterium]
MDRTELLHRIRTGRAQLETALAKFDNVQMNSVTLDNGWTLKDMLAHIGFWEQRAAELYHMLQRGDTPEAITEETEVDALNARAYAENRDRSVEEVRQSEQAAYQTLLSIAETASEADLFDPQRFVWTAGEPFVIHIVINTYEHYEEHLEKLP